LAISSTAITIVSLTSEALKIQGIDNIGLCATDVARSIAFYQKLGFSEQYRNERGVMMSVGAANLFIFSGGKRIRSRQAESSACSPMPQA
jgi:hypothetical protein